MKNVIFLVIIITSSLIAGWFVRGATSGPPANVKAMMMRKGGAQGDVAVFSQEVKKQDISPKIEYIGIVEPIKFVDLKPEISGNVERVLFEEGSLVKKGQVLFKIDSDKYSANLSLKTAELEHANANVVMLEKDFIRTVTLYKDNHISESSLEKAESELAQARASQKQAAANVKLAEIDLENSKIKAPIAGMIGTALVTEGNFVTSGQTSLARIVQQNPIRVAFSVSDKEYLNGKVLGTENIDIEIELANGKILPEKMTSLFVDNQIDKDTATITLYGEYKNTENLLTAGNYVKVIVFEKMDSPVVVVPATAIGEDKYGSYVYLIDKDNKAIQTRIKSGSLIGKTQVVDEGLNGGEKIIIEGLQKISNGAKVKPQEVE